MNFNSQKQKMVFWLMVTILAVVSSAVFAQPVMHLVNGNWYDGERFVQRDYYAVDGLLQESYGGHSTTVDLGGGWVVPGYGDAHTHGVGNGSFGHESNQFLQAGIFYVANPNSLASTSAPAREEAAAQANLDARFANGGLTSPGGHPVQIFEGNADSHDQEGNAYHTIDSPESLERIWPAILSDKPDFVKVYLEESEHHADRRDDPAYYGKRGLDPELIPLIVQRAHAEGLRVAAHITSRHDFRVAVAAGVDEIAHLPLEALEAEDAREAAAKGIVQVTTVLSHRPTDGIEDLDGLHRGNLALLKEAGVRIALGTDSQATVVDEAQKIGTFGVFSRDELLRMLVDDTPKWIFPDRQIGQFRAGAEASFLVLGSNPMEDLTALKDIVMQVKSGIQYSPQALAKEDRPGVGQQLVHALTSKGLEAAVEQYHRMRTEEPDSWDFSEGQLEALANALIPHGMVSEAIGIFQLNCKQFPSSAMAWHNLGSAQAKSGDKEGAEDSFNRALALDPNMKNVNEELTELKNH